jgi:vacuolar-type H+-ATPase subunit I/STV1
LEGLVANSTALAEVAHNNATKIGELQAKASQDAPKLAALKANQTLIVECDILAAEEKLEHDCFELLKLAHFLTFAANSSEVSNQAKNNATRISEIAAEASTSATKLQQLQSNATLVSLCFIVDAHEREKHQCEEIKKLEKFIDFANNSTALADKTRNNATRINEIKVESSKVAARLAKLQSNATLVSDCASFEHHPATVVSAQAGRSLSSLVLNLND